MEEPDPPGSTANNPRSNRGRNSNGPNHRPRKPRNRVPKQDGQQDPTNNNASSQPERSRDGAGGHATRRSRFNASLTEENKESSTGAPKRGSGHDRGRGGRRGAGGNARDAGSAAEDTDLCSILTKGLSYSPYVECLICFNPIHPLQPTWSCSPSIPLLPKEESGEDTHSEPQYCWSTFHLKCVRAWAEKSYNDIKEAWRIRGETNKDGEWRCPGCQGRRSRLIAGYRCFCDSTALHGQQTHNRLSTPHSCGNNCSRARPASSGCPHPCPLQCHPGPCPPCRVILSVACPCPRAKKFNTRCSDLALSKDRATTCGQPCNRPLACGNDKHLCQETCHSGPCPPCNEVQKDACYCGKVIKEARCGTLTTIWSEKVGCGNVEDCILPYPPVEGFSCGGICNSPFDCGIHTCSKPCHPVIKDKQAPAPCPYSPSKVQTCPCGKCPLSSLPVPARTSCTSPVPTCTLPCQKIHSDCGHFCQSKCHLGDCPPCTERVVKICRCGNLKKEMICSQLSNETKHLADDGGGGMGDIRCDRPCTALRSCGRHQCNRLCCPLYPLTVGLVGKGKGKKRANIDDDLIGVSPELVQMHECDLVCGKPLSCGNHRCERKDHKGACPPCLMSTFEEVFCSCGRTVLDPPVPCGTVVQCSYPCSREPGPCGHPKTTHTCHSDDTPCPPCPFLTERSCACGKSVMRNIKCSLEKEKISCGVVCGKLLPCGFHRCAKMCHADDCGACASLCGKIKKLCLPLQHPCTLPCHAPASCPETTPCTSSITLSCQCGRISSTFPCNRCVAAPTGRSETQLAQIRPKCTAECGIAKRNAKLAEALGIDAGKAKKDGESAYSEEIVAFARENRKLVETAEKTFHEFVTGSKRTQVLPHMPPERRKFVIDLASVYRMDTQLVDAEPYRSVQILRRIDTRIPNPTLSSHMMSLAAQAREKNPNLGRLGVNLAGAGASTPWRANAALNAAKMPISAPVPTSSKSGWGARSIAAVVAGKPVPTSSSPVPSTTPIAKPHASGSQTSRSSTPLQTLKDGSIITRHVVESHMVSEPSGGEEAVPDNWEDD